MAEFFADVPIDPVAIDKAKLSLTDGGTGDFDGTANGTCVVHLVICINNNDPRIIDSNDQQCQSGEVDLFHLKKPRPDANKVEDQINGAAILAAAQTLGPSVTTGDHQNILDYGPSLTVQDKRVGTYVSVPLKNGAKAKKMFKTRWTRTDGTKDSDVMTVTCNP
jgi:hypothetical protein